MTTTEVLDAYRELLRMAGTGRNFYHGQVYNPPATAEDPRMQQLVGHGHDLQRSIEVKDFGNDNIVPALVAFRIISMVGEDGGSLFIRVRLTWLTSRDGHHESYAHYDIGREAAEALAADPEPESQGADYEHIASQADENSSDEQQAVVARQFMAAFIQDTMTAVRKASRYNAQWNQHIPMDDDPEGEDDTEVRYTYHGKVVLAAQEANPDMLCMLSSTDTGVVQPDELGKLLRWLREQPELAAARV